MKLIFLGAPGAGKGTQSDLISDRFHLPVIGTGNIIREAVKNQTPAGIQAKSYMDSGDLVPDEIVIQMLQDRLAQEDCKGGFILDGFPRTVPQAEALDRMGVEIDRVVEIHVSDERIERRMSGRRVCEQCGSPYHLEYNPPEKEGVCDRCGGKLTIRKDDDPQTVRDRLKVYHQQTEPLKDFYAKKGILRVVEGQEELADTSALVLKALEDVS